ncbi:exodeoxyribonuclease VII small subunit [Uliginosibacterium sediminicola]|uniref:Exodeoxyribonuclease 7 small subunit n=1 Tax=Uliginosibacterium sediminicola TaxID=2024550 RepID=A0ABU9Z2T0_9RHOO
MKKSIDDASKPPANHFEDAVSELEKIVATMESGSLPLEDSLRQFQRGTELLRQCRDTLENAEQRIRVLQDGVLQELNKAQDKA